MNNNRFRRILITGGAGFIGINMCHYLKNVLDQDAQVDVIDSLEYASNFEELERIGFKLHRIRIQNKLEIESLFEESRSTNNPFELIVNFAAESHVDQSILNPSTFFESNVIGVVVLLDATRKYCPEAVFIQVGTDEVYGDKEFGESEELDLLKPSSPYSASKSSADLLALSYGRTYGLNVMVTRCTNNFGTFQHPEKFIPRIIWNALQDRDIPIYGDGRQSREWISVTDHVDAIWKIANKGKFGEIYNIGSGHRLTNSEITSEILSVMKSNSKLVHVQDRKGHDRRYSVSSKKLSNTLGWNATAEFHEELRQTVLWYSKQYRDDKVTIEKALSADSFYRELS